MVAYLINLIFISLIDNIPLFSVRQTCWALGSPLASISVDFELFSTVLELFDTAFARGVLLSKGEDLLFLDFSWFFDLFFSTPFWPIDPKREWARGMDFNARSKAQKRGLLLRVLWARLVFSWVFWFEAIPCAPSG